MIEKLNAKYFLATVAFATSLSENLFPQAKACGYVPKSLRDRYLVFGTLSRGQKPHHSVTFQIPHSALHTPHSDLHTPISAFRIPHSAFRIPTSDFRLPTSDFRPPTSDLRLHSPTAATMVLENATTSAIASPALVPSLAAATRRTIAEPTIIPSQYGFKAAT